MQIDYKCCGVFCFVNCAVCASESSLSESESFCNGRAMCTRRELLWLVLPVQRNSVSIITISNNHHFGECASGAVRGACSFKLVGKFGRHDVIFGAVNQDNVSVVPVVE